ncbi:MAG: Gfo/Idh/MocA family oxidoreductase [Firmicutes bacterium]|nr:Gfo/Idh/MocA family oxidoreductase [Bacillota bacterium]
MIKIGLLGTGFMGGTHLAAYKRLLSKGGFRVAAVADLDIKKAEKLAAVFGAKVYPSAEELLINADVNTVDICLPTYLHYEYAMKAVGRGYHVFVEKPLCLSGKDAQSLAEAARAKGVISMVGQCIRFWDEYVWLKNCVERKTYGAVASAHFERLSPRPMWSWNGWSLKKEHSGGAALDLHIHDSDYMLYLFGEPAKVASVRNKTGETDGYIMTLCDYSGFVVTLEGTWNLPASYPFEMYYRVVFEKAVVEFSSKTGLKVYTDTGVTVPELVKQCTADADAGGNISDLGGYYNELAYFLDCLKLGNKAGAASLSDGAKSVAFVEKEFASKL